MAELLCGAALGHTNTMNMLVELGCDLHSFDLSFSYAIHFAARGCHISAVEYLINQGVDVGKFF